MSTKFLPAGEKVVCIVKAEVKDNKKDRGMHMAVTLECLWGPDKGKRHIDRFVVMSLDAMAKQKGDRRKFEYIIAACGNPDDHSVRDLKGAMFRPFEVNLVPQTDGDPRLSVTGIKPVRDEWRFLAEDECERLEKLQPTAPSPGGGLDITTMSAVEAQDIDWLWPERFALGKLHMIAGEPGQGKSQFTLFMAAAVTTGGAWPNHEGSAQQGDVIILASEDDAGDTMRPRLEAAGADLSRVHVAKAVVESEEKRRGFNLQTDLPKLEAVLKYVGTLGRTVRLIIIDPVSDYMGDTDTHKETAVRAVLSPLSDFAGRYGVAVVCVAHPPKTPAGGKAVNAITGAKAFVGASRAAWLIAAEFEKGDDGQRMETGRVLFLSIKKNIGRKVNGLAFRIDEKDVPTKRGKTKAPFVSFDDGDVGMSADDMLKPDTGSFGRKPLNKMEEAKAFLMVALKHGPQEQNQLVKQGGEQGLSYSTLARAAKDLGIQSVRQGFGAGSLNMWTFPGAPISLPPGHLVA